MDTVNIINYLNNQQKKAVMSLNNNLLVLAGAGSGKTRVIIHRIAWLLSIKQYSPESIMAMTFTNKAALEIRHRTEDLLKNNYTGMWIGTFHSIAHRILRIHYEDADLPYNFQIIDNHDQIRIFKRLIHDFNLDENKWPIHQAMYFVNNKKELGIRAQCIKNNNNPIEYTWKYIYQNYQDICNRSGLVDFTELLLRVYELFSHKPEILMKYRKRFVNILIDEFQDTNYIQYALIKKLTSPISNIMIVGDEDQSIYGWRGAKIENIQHFIHDFSNVKIINLEQNYRSTNNILQAANCLISHNTIRFNKHLWTNSVAGEPITLYSARNELEEAQFIVNSIKIIHHNGNKLKEFAILYRSNSQSRVIEEELLKTKIPYHIYGGIRFFERQEIKDTIAYLRLIVNRDDDTAYERIVNKPIRNIGERTVRIIQETSQQNKLTLWKSSIFLLDNGLLTKRASRSLRNFLELINNLATKILKLPLYIQTDIVIKYSGLWNMYMNEKVEKSKTRIENLKELVTAAQQFNDNVSNQHSTTLQQFLSHCTLEECDKVNNPSQDVVQLMTIHASKGLEFSQVFLTGMEEGIFPTYMAISNKFQLEEERRLAYVGMTRAMNKLILTYSIKRNIHGKNVYHNLSRFVKELKSIYVKKINPNN